MAQYLYRGRLIRPDPNQTLGEGGEAVVYKVAGGEAVKIYRRPDDRYYLDIPDLEQRRRDQEGARERLEIIQRKLPKFPKPWSPRVITPLELVREQKSGAIAGYGMPLVADAVMLRSFAKRKTRPPGIDNNVVLQILRDLHATVSATHAAGVLIGDFNYFNVLVKLNAWLAYLIDADSMQFGGFLCETYQTKFVDPLVCAPNLTKLVKMKGRPYTAESDWYAFAAMVFETMLLVPLYGGSFEPKNKRRHVELDARPLHRIWAGHPEVIYPRIGISLSCVDDDLLQFYHDLTVKDRRGIFPPHLLEGLRWTTCSNCHTEHCKARCPNCAQAVPAAAVKETVRGKVRMLRVFRTSGLLLRAALQDEVLHYLYHKDGAFYRGASRYEAAGRRFTDQHEEHLLTEDLSAHMRFGIQGGRAVIGLHGQLLVLPDATKLNVDSYRDDFPAFGANEKHLYWSSAGELLRSAPAAPEFIGNVVPGQTRFWVGPSFGFGLYQTGQIQVGFVFDAERRGINDNVALPPPGGQLIDCACYFDRYRCWFLSSIRTGSSIVNRCHVIRPDGRIDATAEAEDDDGSWLGGIHGKCAATLPKAGGGAVHVLFSAGEAGIARIHEDGAQLVEAAAFPDTKGFVNSDHELILGREGLYVIDRREIRCLQLG